ncbi:MAG: CorA family divalent cation transporter [Patescibacteria group bacterium]
MRGISYPSVRYKRIEWINLDHARKHDIDAIAQVFGLNEQHAQSLCTRDHRSHVYEGNGYTLVCLVHPIFDQAADDIQARELDVILTPTRLVTVHHGHLLPVSARFQNVSANPSALEQPVRMFGELLHDLLVDASHTIDHISTSIDAFEGALLRRPGRGSIQQILQIQTNVIDAKKLLENQRYMVDRLLLGQPERVRRSVAMRFDEIRSHQAELSHILETELQAAQTLHHVLDASINERTNALIRALTILSLIMLPATLLAGIFGMNAAYPWILGAPFDFSIIIGIMLLIGALILFLIRSKKL